MLESKSKSLLPNVYQSFFPLFIGPRLKSMWSELSLHKPKWLNEIQMPKLSFFLLKVPVSFLPAWCVADIHSMCYPVSETVVEIYI